MDEKLWDLINDEEKMKEEAAKAEQRTYFGQVTLDVQRVVLQKGVKGGIPFDPKFHKSEQAVTMIQIIVTPLPSSTATFDTERNVIAERREWAGIILPSIKTLGIEAQHLHEKYVRYEMVPTGRKWINDEGEEKTLTTFKFLAYYNTLEEAEEAAAKLYGGGNGQQAQTSSNGGERDVALKFLPALAAQANGDVTKLAEIIAANPLVSQHFDIDSPEVIALLTQQPA